MQEDPSLLLLPLNPSSVPFQFFDGSVKRLKKGKRRRSPQRWRRLQPLWLSWSSHQDNEDEASVARTRSVSHLRTKRLDSSSTEASSAADGGGGGGLPLHPYQTRILVLWMLVLVVCVIQVVVFDRFFLGANARIIVRGMWDPDRSRSPPQQADVFGTTITSKVWLHQQQQLQQQHAFSATDSTQRRRTAGHVKSWRDAVFQKHRSLSEWHGLRGTIKKALAVVNGDEHAWFY